jgi:hypothetical protein
MTVYSPEGKNTGVAVVVFPGGGFEGLAIDLEGTEVCDWLTSKGITCVLLKYRVPSLPYDWRCKCRPDGFAISTLALEDAQRTVGLVRSHAAECGPKGPVFMELIKANFGSDVTTRTWDTVKKCAKA